MQRVISLIAYYYYYTQKWQKSPVFKKIYGDIPEAQMSLWSNQRIIHCSYHDQQLIFDRLFLIY